jgi:hypothetical protein
MTTLISYSIETTNLPMSPQLTRCSYSIVERIVMLNHKATEKLAPSILKKPDLSKDFVHHIAPRKEAKVYKIAPTKIGKLPIYKFFIDFDGKYFS